MRHAREQDEMRAPSPGAITGLNVQKKDSNRMSVFLDGEFAFGVHKELVIRFDLYRGRSLEVQEQADIRIADAVMRARRKALDYLSYKDRTEQEVRRKLERKEFSAEVIDQAIKRLYELHYLDDASYAQKYAAGSARRGYGPQRVQGDLRRRGVERMHIDAAVEEEFNPQATLAGARRQAARRAPRLAREEDIFKRKQKLSAFLLRRGFPYEVAHRVVEEIAREGWVTSRET